MKVPRLNSQTLVLLLLAGVALASPLYSPSVEGAQAVLRPLILQFSGIAALAWVLGRATPGPRRLLGLLADPVNLPLVGLVAWASLSYLLAIPRPGRAAVLGLEELVRLGSGGAALLAVRYLCDSRDALRNVATLLLWAGIAVAVQTFVGYGSGEETGEAARGGFTNPQLFAAHVLLLLPVAAAFVELDRLHARSLLALAGTLMLLACLFLSRDRGSGAGAVIGLLVAGGTLGLLRRRRLAVERHRLVLPVLLLLGGIILAAIVAKRDPQMAQKWMMLAQSETQGYAQARLAHWQVAGAMLQRYPLTGVGIGSYPLHTSEFVSPYYEQFIQPDFELPQSELFLTAVPHSEYVYVIGELGLVGLAWYLAVLFGAVGTTLRAMRHLRSETSRRLSAGCTGSAVGALVSMATNPAWHFTEIHILLMLLLGLSVAASSLRSPGLDAAEAAH